LLADLRDAAACIRAGWTGLSGRRKGVLAGILLLLGLLILDLVWIGILRGLGESVLASVYHGTAPPPLQRLFDSVATDAYKTPLEAYVAKFEAFYTEVRLPLLFLLPLVGLVVASLFLPGVGQAWGFSRTITAEPMLWMSAFLLGATVCVRQLGAFVGGLVSLYFLYRTRLKAAFPLVLYWAAGAAVTYATWPYLWPNPIRRFMESLFFAAQFPPHHTFFEGRWMSSRIAPWYYFPKLAAIELTEPAVVLLLLGAAAALWRLRRNRAHWFLYSLLALWVGVPFAGLVFFDMTAYGNIRHLLFTLPALLILAGIGLAVMTELPIVIAHMGHPWLAETIVLVRKHPNLYADISALHYRPWQFYNGLVLALEYGVEDKLLFGSDWPFTTPAETAAELRRINRFTEGTSLPRIPEEVIEAIIGRDGLALLGLSSSS